MFTGIIESLATVEQLTDQLLKIKTGPEITTKRGDSIAINGCCLTVTEHDLKNNENHISFQISQETINCTNLSSTAVGDRINIERAMLANARFDGHMVSGHIDCVAKILKIKEVKNCWEFTFFSDSLSVNKHICSKGCICINGISLTVNDVVGVSKGLEFTTMIIPETWKNTNLSSQKESSLVNIESDVVAKYVESILSARNNI